MRDRSLVLSLGVALLATGCVGGDEAATDEGLGPTGTDTFGDPTDAPLPTGTPDATDDAAAPSLGAPPQWRLGEWWRVRLTDELAGGSVEATRVVAGIEGGYYLTGMPRDEFVDDIMLLHVPGMGQVDRRDLGFEIHDALFTPVRFPLTDGLSWDTAFEGQPITATATVRSETEAEVEFIGPNNHLVATYDAGLGELSKLVIDGYGTVEVIDHGYDYQGIVTVPHMHDLVFFNFRVAGVVGTGSPAPVVGGLGPSAPVETVTIDTTYDRVSFALIVAPLAQADTVLGVFGERVTAPDGTMFEGLSSTADGPGWRLWLHSYDDPGGDWQIEHIAGGAGVAGVEGIGYHVYDVDLPSGRILPSTGEHPHGG